MWPLEKVWTSALSDKEVEREICTLNGFTFIAFLSLLVFPFDDEWRNVWISSNRIVKTHYCFLHLKVALFYLVDTAQGCAISEALNYVFLGGGFLVDVGLTDLMKLRWGSPLICGLICTRLDVWSGSLQCALVEKILSPLVGSNLLHVVVLMWCIRQAYLHQLFVVMNMWNAEDIVFFLNLVSRTMSTSVKVIFQLLIIIDISSILRSI